MKVALVANSDALHTIRWANGLSERDIEVHLISAHPFSASLSSKVRQHRLPYSTPWGYVSNALRLRKVMAGISPDVVNAHYASGYGTLATLSGVKPLMLSVWGSDVFDFPKKSPLHHALIQRNLSRANAVCSISHVMATQCRSLSSNIRDLKIVPWGVDSKIFTADTVEPDDRFITIGTVKVMQPKYGIDTLIEGFALYRQRLAKTSPAQAERLRLRLVGGGPQLEELKALAQRKGIGEVTNFVGPVPHDQVAKELSQLDLYVAVSRLDSESFGVAIVEAQACGRPVIVSDAGGLPEVVQDGETGIVVPRESPEKLADAMQQMLGDDAFRAQLAENGRLWALDKYEWRNNVAQMEEVYREVSNSARPHKIAA